MSKVRVHITVSADGYVAGPNQSLENPLGEGGGSLHDWAFPLRAFREPHGMNGGEVSASTPVVEESLSNVGAEIMGRGKFGGGPGPWGDDPWAGWWGETRACGTAAPASALISSSSKFGRSKRPE